MKNIIKKKVISLQLECDNIILAKNIDGEFFKYINERWIAVTDAGEEILLKKGMVFKP